MFVKENPDKKKKSFDKFTILLAFEIKQLKYMKKNVTHNGCEVTIYIK